MFVIGADPKIPCQKRQIKMVWIFVAAPQPNANMMDTKYGIRTTHLRP